VSSHGAPGRPVLAASTGFGGGFLAGILGGGGGAVMVPLMTGPMRMSQHVAHGTSLAIITVTAAVAAVIYSVNESISFALVAALSFGAIAGAILGAKGAARVPAMQLRQLFGIFLIAVSARLLFWESVTALIDVSGTLEIATGGAIGFAGGLASGALGVGGGAIFVPALVLLLGVGQHEAQGVSLWVVVVASVMGAATHNRQGTVDMQAAKWIAPAALPGALIGAILATYLGGRSLQVVFAIVLSLIGIQMLATARRRMRMERANRVAMAVDPA